MDNNLLKKYANYFASPYLVWIFMAVNAIKDVALFVDGPDCNFFRVDMIYKTHDLFSTLKQPSINTRLYFSWVMPNKMVLGYENTIKRKLEFIEKNDNFKLGVIANMPVTSLLWIQYDWIVKNFKKKFLIVPTYPDKFRIDWYSLFLRQLARQIELNENLPKEKKSISIVGYLFDRNEGDNLGNIEEVKRLMSLIGVKVNSIWLSGWNYEELKNVEKSELLVVLPYGKYAWKVLKKRLWVDILEVELPFGLKNTINFVKTVWEKVWIDKRLVNKVLKKEIQIVKEKISMLDKKKFLNKKFIYAGDPNLLSWIEDFSNLLWMNLIRAFSYNWDKIFYDEIEKDKLDFVIWNSEFDIDGVEKIEFWFPSYNNHFLTNRAFMWFEGVLNFVERIYNSLLN